MKDRIRTDHAIVVEGKDDVDAVSRACDALIIPTHGFGITAETWSVIEKAYNEKGLIILTDPDSAGERIRRRLTEKFPDAVQCYIDRADAMTRGDIGVENANPETIAAAVAKAIELAGRPQTGTAGSADTEVTAADLIRLGLAGDEGSAQIRAAVCKELGIGYSNARAMLRKLRGFNIGIAALEEAVDRIRK